MPRVTRRPLAQTDILEIWDFIADDSVAAADRWVDHLDEQKAIDRVARLMISAELWHERGKVAAVDLGR